MEPALNRVLTRHMGAQDLETVNRGRLLRVIPQGPRLEALEECAQYDPTLRIVALEPLDESAVCRGGLYGVFRVVPEFQEAAIRSSDSCAVEVPAQGAE